MKRTFCIVVAITIAFMIAVFAGSDKDSKIGIQNTLCIRVGPSYFIEIQGIPSL